MAAKGHKRGIPIRRLRLAVEPAFASGWLVPRLGRFATTHPQIELELETPDELRVLGRDADFAIRYIAANSRRKKRRWSTPLFGRCPVKTSSHSVSTCMSRTSSSGLIFQKRTTEA